MTASTRNTIRTEISRIPMPVRNGALQALGVPCTTPIQDIDQQQCDVCLGTFLFHLPRKFHRVFSTVER
jgi:hypothetical protein